MNRRLADAADWVAARLGWWFVRWCNDPRRSRTGRLGDRSPLGNLFRAYGWWMVRVRDPLKHARRQEVRT